MRTRAEFIQRHWKALQLNLHVRNVNVVIRGCPLRRRMSGEAMLSKILTRAGQHNIVIAAPSQTDAYIHIFIPLRLGWFIALRQ